ncbi:MAG: hypothetical protein N3I35_08785 [Clostridia bacterium]|nr:hypothetical protein [Clostridia bacterium]
MKKLKKSYAAIMAAIVLSFFLGQIVQAVTETPAAEPGSDGDPLVTQGYVDKKDNGLKSSIDKLNKQSKFIVLEVGAGKQLITGAGTEIVLRAGKAAAIRGSYGGLSDVTAGKDISSGVAIPYNHLLISSRDDGRGIKITAKVWVLVRGSYKIK